MSNQYRLCFRLFSLLVLLLYSLSGVTQTCNDRILSTKPASDFEMPSIDNNLAIDEVKDTKTQLIWKRCSEGQNWVDSNCEGTIKTYDWAEALALGTDEWRLPNIQELSSIVEMACYNPAIDSTVFPNSSSGIYWSSSPYIEERAAIIFFSDGHNGARYNYSLLWLPMEFHVRLVKDVQ